MREATVPSDVLMVGSVPGDTVTEVISRVCGSLPGLLEAVPDGEVGERWCYILWQASRFPPEARRLEFGGPPLPATGKPTYNLDSVGPTGYDDAAIASYADFLELRKKGVVPEGVRFQIGLPTPLNCMMHHLKPEVQADIEPFYEERMKQTLIRIAENIPHKDMVIQWDMPMELAALEHEQGRMTGSYSKPYFSPIKAGIVERVVRTCDSVPRDVSVAFHLCYGDYMHAHFIEPADTGLMVDLANDIIKAVSTTHTVEWLHMPVPRSRVDAAYYEPLNRLRLQGTRLYLGLVHANDDAGTTERIKVAQATYPHPFGVSTECGLGRTPKEEIDSIFKIFKAVTGPSGR